METEMIMTVVNFFKRNYRGNKNDKNAINKASSNTGKILEMKENDMTKLKKSKMNVNRILEGETKSDTYKRLKTAGSFSGSWNEFQKYYKTLA